jgi:hypothetical protein
VTTPIKGPPIGVLPRNTIACRASTRPRISGAVRSCTVAVVAVMNTMLAKPRNSAAGNELANVGMQAITTMLAPNSAEPLTTSLVEIVVRRAVTRAAISDPTATTE